MGCFLGSNRSLCVPSEVGANVNGAARMDWLRLVHEGEQEDKNLLLRASSGGSNIPGTVFLMY